MPCPSVEFILSIALALLIGIMAGLLAGFLGIGAGVLMIPAMLIFLDMDIFSAKASSLVAILVLSPIGARRHAAAGHINLRAGVMLGVPGFTGALAGTALSAYMNAGWLEISFSLFLFGMAVYMLGNNRKRRKRGGRNRALLWPAGLAAGFLGGLIGVGGGLLMVPAMLATGIGMHTAVGTSLLAIIFIAGAGTAAHMGAGMLALDVFLRATLPMLAGAAAGVALGASAAAKTPSPVLRRVFSVVMVVAAVYLLWKGLV